MQILLIHPRKGLYQLTRCQNCGHKFECQNCSNYLTTYQGIDNSNFSLLCHQCQTAYTYPQNCPNCGSKDIQSRFGGIDNLQEVLEKELNQQIRRLDSKSKQNQKSPLITPKPKTQKKLIDLTTRLFDPSISYIDYDLIVFIKAENLLATPDYLVQEETQKALTEIMIRINPEKTKIIMDTNDKELSFYNQISRNNLRENYLEFLDKENQNRHLFGFSPAVDMLLLTTQEKNYQKAKDKIDSVYKYLLSENQQLPQTSLSKPYKARFLKRKNMYSFHILLKYPKNYKHFPFLHKTILGLQSLYNLQVRLNPKHLF